MKPFFVLGVKFLDLFLMMFFLDIAASIFALRLLQQQVGLLLTVQPRPAQEFLGITWGKKSCSAMAPAKRLHDDGVQQQVVELLSQWFADTPSFTTLR